MKNQIKFLTGLLFISNLKMKYMLSVLVLCKQEGLFYTFFHPVTLRAGAGVLPIRNFLTCKIGCIRTLINRFSWLDFKNISCLFLWIVLLGVSIRVFNMQLLCESALLLSYVNLALPNLSFYYTNKKNYSSFALRSKQATTFPLSVYIQNYSTNSLAGAPPKGAVKIYVNVYSDKKKIILENIGKSGVYRWTNLTNGKSYIGSSVNLGRRFRCYFKISFLEKELKRSRSLINSSFLKYRYSNFSLEILEYCAAASLCIEREQYYLDLFQPEYNILKKAGSSFGSKRSAKTKAKLSAALRGRKHSLEAKAKMSAAWTVERKAKMSVALTEEQKAKRLEHLKNLHANPEFQAKRLEHLKNLHASQKGRARPEGAGRPSISLEVFDSQTNQTTIYPSIREAAREVGMGESSIRTAFTRKGGSTVWVQNKRYKITKCNRIA